MQNHLRTPKTIGKLLTPLLVILVLLLSFAANAAEPLRALVFPKAPSGHIVFDIVALKNLVQEVQDKEGELHPQVFDLLASLSNLLLDQAADESAKTQLGKKSVEELVRQAMLLNFYEFALKIRAHDMAAAEAVLFKLNKHFGSKVFSTPAVHFRTPVLGLTFAEQSVGMLHQGEADHEILGKAVIQLFKAVHASNLSEKKTALYQIHKLICTLIAKHPSRFLKLGSFYQTWILNALKKVLTLMGEPSSETIIKELRKTADDLQKSPRPLSSAQVAALAELIGDYETSRGRTAQGQELFIGALGYLSDDPSADQLPQTPLTLPLWEKILKPFFRERQLSREVVRRGYSFNAAEEQVLDPWVVQDHLEGLHGAQRQTYGINHPSLVRTLYEQAWAFRQGLNHWLEIMNSSEDDDKDRLEAKGEAITLALAEQAKLRNALHIIQNPSVFAARDTNTTTSMPSEYEVTLALGDAITYGYPLTGGNETLNEGFDLLQRAAALAKATQASDLGLALDHLFIILEVHKIHGQSHFPRWKELLLQLKPLIAQIRKQLVDFTELEALQNAHQQGWSTSVSSSLSSDGGLRLKRRRFLAFCYDVIEILESKAQGDQGAFFSEQASTLQAVMKKLRIDTGGLFHGDANECENVLTDKLTN